MDKEHSGQSIFERIADPVRLFEAWDEFKRGKGKKKDVMRFERDLEENIFRLSRDLRAGAYRHGPYSAFHICDPKRRHVHKAAVRDRVLHHAVFTALVRVFEPGFIADSFSCRVGKGTHKGVAALERMLGKESRNRTRTAYALKCDVSKFFDSVDHRILLSILRRKISDEAFFGLLREIVGSYESGRSDLFSRRGVPIGNLTSQIFANIYMNEFDQFMKHVLKIRHYARYTDDFLVVSADRGYLEALVAPIRAFLKERLALDLHPGKIVIRKYRQGVDFLGFVALPHCRLLRARTRRRMFRKLRAKIREFRLGIAPEAHVERSLQSYLGILSHADAHDLAERLRNQCWLWMKEVRR